MRLPGHQRRDRRQGATESELALTDLEAKDKIIDDLLEAADGLVSELRLSLSQASAVLHGGAGEGDDGDR